MRYITELTPPVTFYLRGEEYSAQLEAFGRAIRDAGEARQNDFASSADTDATIEMIRAAALGAAGGQLAPSVVPARRAGLAGRLFGR